MAAPRLICSLPSRVRSSSSLQAIPRAPTARASRRVAQQSHFTTSCTMSANSPTGQKISETAKAEGGTSKGSLSAQMQSQVTKQRNAEQATGDVASTMVDDGVPVDQANPTISKIISQTAKAEGGPSKGSLSAQMQSQVTKQRNAEQATGTTMADDAIPANQADPTTSEIISETAKAEGGPSKGSLSAQMQSQVTQQRNAEPTTGNVTGGRGVPSDSMAADAQRLANANERVDSPGSGRASVSDNTGGAGLNRTAQSQAYREKNFLAAAADVEAKIDADPLSVTKEDGDLLHSRETKAYGATQKGGVASTAQHLAAENEKAKGRV